MQTDRQEMLSGARIVIETLIEQGVTDVFGYPGGQVVDIYDELYKAGDRINHVLTAHEQGASHAADGYSRVTGRVGVVIATSGPGATNLVTGIATAMLDSVPMVAITGNVATTNIGRDSFQEVNITGITIPITKHNYFVSDVRELADTIREAFRIAKSGRPGPVLIDIPKDVQVALCGYEPQPVVEPYRQAEISDEEIDRAVQMINEAKRPYIYIGGGAAGAGLSEDVMAFAEKIDGYIGCTFMGLSAVPSAFPRFLGMQGMHGHYASSMANKEADLIIGVGIRFSDRATGNVKRYSPNARIIQLDADVAEIGKNIRADIGLAGDIRSAFRRIARRCESARRPEWSAQVAALRAEERRIAEAEERADTAALAPRAVFRVINELKGRDTLLATDVGQHQMWAAQYLAFERPRSFASSGGLGTMGYGMGAAIGAHIATGERVILITGDGSFGMNLNELATAVSYRVPLTIVLVNNGALGMVRQWQTLFYGKRYSNTVLDRQTDFVKLAEAFGAAGSVAEDLGSFRAALETALACEGPYLIDTRIDRDEIVLPMLPPGGSIDDIITTRNREGGDGT